VDSRRPVLTGSLAVQLCGDWLLRGGQRSEGLRAARVWCRLWRPPYGPSAQAAARVPLALIMMAHHPLLGFSTHPRATVTEPPLPLPCIHHWHRRSRGRGSSLRGHARSSSSPRTRLPATD
jgi:hypothetical protein